MTLDIVYPDRNISLDLTFWVHHSIFAGNQHQLDQLRHEADARAAARVRQRTHPHAAARVRQRTHAHANIHADTRDHGHARQHHHARATTHPASSTRQPASRNASRPAPTHPNAHTHTRPQANTRTRTHTHVPSIYTHHRPATRRLTAVLHVNLIPLLWAITTCHCGHRWPCNDIKQHIRAHRGWTVDITDDLRTITRQLPKPQTRLSRLRHWLSRKHRTTVAESRPNTA